MGKNAVTLLELMVVIIIIAILAAIAVPVYTGKIERTRGERAIANIDLIVTAYKQYYIKNNQSPELLNLPAINNTLDMDLSDANFNYSITDQGGTMRWIEAVRNSGSYNNRRIRYNLDPASGTPDDWDKINSTWPWMP